MDTVRVGKNRIYKQKTGKNMNKERMQMPDKVIMAIIDVIILIGLIVYCRFVGNEDWTYVILIYLPIALLLVLVGNYIGLLIRKSSKNKEL